MSIIAWIVLGAIAGYLAGFLVKGDEGLGVIGHIVLGIVGALVGGFLAERPVQLASRSTARSTSARSSSPPSARSSTVVVVSMVTGRTRTGSGPV